MRLQLLLDDPKIILDLNGDGKTDPGDLTVILPAWTSNQGDLTTILPAWASNQGGIGANLDGLFNILDLLHIPIK